MAGIRGGRVRGLVFFAGAWVVSPAAAQPTTTHDAPQLGFSPQALAHRDHTERPSTFAERAERLGLRPAPGGGWSYEQEGGRVKATIREDGTVVLDVEEGVQIDIDAVCVVVLCVDTRNKTERKKSRRERAKRVAAKTATELLVGTAAAIAGGSRGGSGSVSRSSPSAPTSVETPLAGAPYANPWGVPSGDPAHDHSRLTPPVLPYASIHGRYGFLPYPHLAVATFLDRTFDFRLDLARRSYTQRIDAQAARLPEELLEIWRGPGSAAERRAQVLERWAELAPAHVDPVVESAMDEDVDPARREAAQRARGVIQKFVELHVPADSKDAFTSKELHRFNAAFGDTDQFWPYGRAPDAG